MASRRRKRVVDEFERSIERAMRRLILRTWQVLTVESPVLTGFFRAGWVPSTGAPEPGPALGPADEAARRQVATVLFSANEKKANVIASSYKLAKGLAFIVNGVRYGVFLNQGPPVGSAQAPAMFVEMGIKVAVAATQRELSRGG